MQDYTLAMQLVEAGSASLQWGPAFVAGALQGGDAAAVFFGVALTLPSARLQELVLDPAVAPLNSSGSQGLMFTRPSGLLEGQMKPHAPAGGAAWAAGSAQLLPAGTAGTSGSHACASLSAATGAGSGRWATHHAGTAGTAHIGRDSRCSPQRCSETGGAGGEVSAVRKSRSPAAGRGGPYSRGGFRGVAEPEWTLGGWGSTASLMPPSEHASAVPVARAASASLRSAASAAAPAPRNADIPPSRRRQPAGGSEGNTLGSYATASLDTTSLPQPSSSSLLVTRVGAKALASALTANPGGYLTTLALSNNALGAEGVELLAQGLHLNFTLKTLLLR